MNTDIFFFVDTRAQATAVIAELKAASIDDERISIVLNETSQTNEVADDPALPHYESKSTLITALAGAAGIGAGAALGWMVIGPFMAIGPLVAAIGGATVGGATAGLLGALAGAGVPDQYAEACEKKILEGSVLIAVHPKDHEEKNSVDAILKGRGLEPLNAKEAHVVE